MENFDHLDKKDLKILSKILTLIKYSLIDKDITDLSSMLFNLLLHKDENYFLSEYNCSAVREALKYSLFGEI